MTTSLPRLLLAGCGDIACRLAALLQRDFRLTGLRRHPEDLPDYIEPLAVDLCDSSALSAALAGRAFDYVVITLTPGERTEQRYRQVYIEATHHLLANLSGMPRVFFVSSTSVYAQQHGEWVDENSEAVGSGFSGRCLLEAEQVVQQACGPRACCVRFSGIYGPGRERMLRLVSAGNVPVAEAAQWSNRIHADDCARVLAFLIQRWQAGIAPAAVYVASDTAPAQLGTVWAWLAQSLGVASPLVDDRWQAVQPGGKRCNSQRLQGEGFSFQYPDFREGYRQLLDTV